MQERKQEEGQQQEGHRQHRIQQQKQLFQEQQQERVVTGPAHKFMLCCRARQVLCLVCLKAP
jgi:hypothetical protein